MLCYLVFQVALVSELRTETLKLETALTAERFRVERMIAESAKKDAKILEQGEAMQKMAEMAQQASLNLRSDCRSMMDVVSIKGFILETGNHLSQLAVLPIFTQWLAGVKNAGS